MHRGTVLSVMIVAFASFASAQVRRGDVIVPDSSIEKPGDAGVRAHTNFVIYSPQGVTMDTSQPTGETPASLGCIYGLVPNPITGCPKATSVSNPTGGSGIIVIVDAFHYPTAAADLKKFSTQFGLPAPKFHQITLGSATNCGWEEEESLDIEWAHAMAPNATILLVEAKDNSTKNLLAAVDQANALLSAHHVKGQLSMSWQSGEYSGETTDDAHFTTPGIVYFASSGDTGGVVGWPSVSPNVVSAGGTTIHRNGAGLFLNESAWSGSGGGNSIFEARPSFQDVISTLVGSHRGTPDYSYDADPFSGVSVYNSSPDCGNLQWQVFGGTSVSSPALAGVVNSIGSFNTTSNAENTEIYSNMGDSTIFTDITTGHCGSHVSGAGWDFCTGVGTNVGKTGK
jgi:kumamolisin